MDNSTLPVTPQKQKIATPKKTPRKRKRTENSVSTKALAHFKTIPEEEWLKSPNKTHVCRHCDAKISGSKEWNLAQHLQKCHDSIYEEITGEKDSVDVRRLKFVQNCVEIVSVNGRPFSYLLDSGFASMVKDKLDDFKSAGCAINLTNLNLVEIKNHLQHTAEQVQDEIRQETQNQSLSLLVDIVTRQRRSICGFSVQYILDGELKVRSIGMIQLSQSHTGKYIAEVIIKRLKEYGIDLKQIITITTDNGSNVLKMVRDIHEHLQAEIDRVRQTATNEQIELIENDIANEGDTDALIDGLLSEENEISDDEAYQRLMEEVDFDQDNSTLLNAMSAEIASIGVDVWDITGINCAEHTLQLAVKDAVSKLPRNFNNVIKLCRRVCSFLRLQSTLNALDAIGMEHTVPRTENETRWGSTYLMVCSICY